MPSICLVVGHRNAGKSTTIRTLFGKRGWAKLGGRDWFVRVMSNCDELDSYRDFVSRLDPTTKPRLVMAYCPEAPPHLLLRELQKRYAVYAWVLATSPGGGVPVSPNEIAEFRRLGVTVGVTGLAGGRPGAYSRELSDFLHQIP